MGSCIGIHRDSNGHNTTSSEADSHVSSTRRVGKNHALKRERLRWKSDISLTKGQLMSKRDEFWDTAPAFEGRKEIWDALKAAAIAAEAGDYDLAQAIIDGANIVLPYGTLSECYDELGNRYLLPIYCLSYPINIIQEVIEKDSPSELLESLNGTDVLLKVRLSTTGKDSKLTVKSTDTVLNAKKRLQLQEGVESWRQRWYFSGKLLGDKLQIEDVKIHPHYIVQVIINTDPYLPSGVDS